MFQSIKDDITKELRPESSDIRPSDWEVLSKYWYPIVRIEDVGEKPVPATLLDVQLVVFCGAEGIATVVDRCPHRWVKLSAGTVKNGNIECPYHALQFSGSGQCVHIPGALKSSGSSKVPKAYRVESFPVKERYGLVWTCLDESSETDLPKFPGISNYKLLYNEPRECAASALRQIENFIDLAHLPIVHKATVGGDPNDPITPAEVTAENGVVKIVADYNEIPLGKRVRPVTFTHQVTLPFTVDLTISDDSGIDSRFINVTSPVSAFACRAFQILVDTRDAGANHASLIDATNIVNSEDQYILSNMPRVGARLDGKGEIHLSVDSAALAYRRALLELGLGQ